MTVQTTAKALGSARRSTEPRKVPLILRPSGSKERKKDGYASMIRSISVIWIGAKGKGMLPKTQIRDNMSE